MSIKVLQNELKEPKADRVEDGTVLRFQRELDSAAEPKVITYTAVYIAELDSWFTTSRSTREEGSSLTAMPKVLSNSGFFDRIRQSDIVAIEVATSWERLS